MANFIDRTITSNVNFVRGPLSEKGFGTVLLMLADDSPAGVFTAGSLKEVEDNFQGNDFVIDFASVFFSQINSDGNIPGEIKIVGNFEQDLVATLDSVLNDLNEEFYIVCIEPNIGSSILLVSAWVETNKKVFIPLSRDNNIADGQISNDVASQLKLANAGLGYDRTCLVASRTPVQQVFDLTITTGIIVGNIIRFKSIAKDALLSYDGSIADTEFITDEVTTLNLFKTNLEGIKITRNGIEEDLFSSIVLVTGPVNTFTCTVASNILLMVLNFSTSNNAITANYISTTESILGDILKKGDAVFSGNRTTRQSGQSTLAYQIAYSHDPDVFTTDELNTLDTKRSNYIVSNREGVVSYQGIMSSGLYFDEIRATDEINERIKEAINRLFVTKQKVSFSEIDLAEIENVIFNAINIYIDLGVVLGGSIQVNVKTVSEVTPGEKASRKLEGTTYSYTLSGAIHQIEVQGTVER